MTDIAELKGIQFFADLTEDELKVVSKITKKKEFQTGETVFKDGDEGESLYIIRKGEVKACKMAPDGELFTLALMKEGEIFGEMSFLDGRLRSATLIPLTDIETLMIERDDFEALVENHPWIVYKLMKNVVFAIHSIVRGMNNRYVEMVNYMWGRKR
ncbi:MAG: cyclic nucleotide-binding domain-containing protein [Deltaproteobacteria bacterium]|nr:cyclic nucleotide-binding domain-containing protein [Deltaproteobacteria bacterium]